MTFFNGIIGDIEEIIGFEPTVKIIQEYAGGNLFVPSKPREGQKLVKLIGLDAACALSKSLGYGQLHIPAANFIGQGRRRALAARLRKEGYSVRQVAKIADVCERTVTRARYQDEQELPLFE